MAELLPHNKGRVPGYWTARSAEYTLATDLTGPETLGHDEVPHPMAGNFPSDHVYSTGTVEGEDLLNFPLDPEGGIAGPILADSEITAITAGTAPAASTYTPANCELPADLADLNALSTASGDDLGQGLTWTIGQFVRLGDGSLAHWNGTTWIAGAHPGP